MCHVHALITHQPAVEVQRRTTTSALMMRKAVEEHSCDTVPILFVPLCFWASVAAGAVAFFTALTSLTPAPSLLQSSVSQCFGVLLPRPPRQQPHEVPPPSANVKDVLQHTLHLSVTSRQTRLAIACHRGHMTIGDSRLHLLQDTGPFVLGCMCAFTSAHNSSGCLYLHIVAGGGMGRPCPALPAAPRLDRPRPVAMEVDGRLHVKMW